MKNLITCLVLLVSFPAAQSFSPRPNKLTARQPVSNLFIITVDGFRWQEVFNGADSALINNEQYTADTAYVKPLYWASTESERRQKLMPFFWSVLSKNGQLYGNRGFDNKVNTANLYNFSYPGYNEILTGTTDLLVASNAKKKNSNRNVLECLNEREAFKDKVVAFTSWDVFPYILNKERSRLFINSGYDSVPATSAQQALFNRVQEEGISEKSGTRYDQLTFLAAKDYISHAHPRVVLLGLGETDEYAHSGRYDLYLEQANKVDKMIAELWHWIQTTPGYRNNTAILITTDHGRGRNGHWTSHSSFIRGSSQTWLALMGPGIDPIGEVKENQQMYQREIAQLIAGLLGEDFDPGKAIATRR